MSGARRTVVMSLAAAGASLAWLGLEAGSRADGNLWAQMAVTVALAGGLGALWMLFARLNRHFRDLDDLNRDLSKLDDRFGSSDGSSEAGDEVGRLRTAIADRKHRRGLRAGPSPVTALVALAGEPLVLVDGAGRITAANIPAVRRLGVRAEPGRDVFELFQRPGFLRAVERARSEAGPVSAVLNDADGAELTARVCDLGLETGVAVLLGSGEWRSPAAQATAESGVRRYEPAPDDPLVTVSMMTLWAATTAVDPAAGRLVALGGVRMSGPRVFHTVSLDLYVDSGELITAEAAAIHGITNEHLGGVRAFDQSWSDIERMLRGCVVVGFGIATVLDVLRRERALVGLTDPFEPPAFDLADLATALDPAAAGRSFEDVCRLLAINPNDRFGVFAPAHAAAELTAALITLAVNRGAATYAAARVLAEEGQRARS